MPTPKHRPTPTEMFGDAMRDLLPYTQLGWQLAITILLAFGAGMLLDRWLGTGRLLTIVMAVLGVAAGLWTVLRSARQLDADARRRKEERTSQSSHTEDS
jgi:F0F1-type ATP synthase assembly protein I